MWSGLSHSTSTIVLHRDQFMSIQSVTELYHQCHTNVYVSTRMKGDKLVNYALDSKLEREGHWTHKKLTVVASDNTSKDAAANPTSNTLKDVKKAAKTLIRHQYHTEHLKHITNLAVQEDFFRFWETMDVDFECKADIYGLPRGVAKFLLSSVLKSLPTKDNLHKWGKIISEACDLCCDRETIAHVLSGCKLMLDQGRYKWHHDSTLNKITEFVNQVNDSDLIINVDLGEKPWTIPPDLLGKTFW